MKSRKLSTLFNIIALITALSIIFLSLNNYVFLAVVEGQSMEPLLQTGDIVIVYKVDEGDLRLGDIVVYKKSDGSLIIHRIIDIYETSSAIVIITKGDNNAFPDPPITADQVIGKVLSINGYVVKIPMLGYLSLIIRRVFSSYTA